MYYVVVAVSAVSVAAAVWWFRARLAWIAYDVVSLISPTAAMFFVDASMRYHLETELAIKSASSIAITIGRDKRVLAFNIASIQFVVIGTRKGRDSTLKFEKDGEQWTIFVDASVFNRLAKAAKRQQIAMVKRGVLEQIKSSKGGVLGKENSTANPS